jgi:hypothetical protein
MPIPVVSSQSLFHSCQVQLIEPNGQIPLVRIELSCPSCQISVLRLWPGPSCQIPVLGSQLLGPSCHFPVVRSQYQVPVLGPGCKDPVARSQLSLPMSGSSWEVPFVSSPLFGPSPCCQTPVVRPSYLDQVVRSRLTVSRFSLPGHGCHYLSFRACQPCFSYPVLPATSFFYRSSNLLCSILRKLWCSYADES